MKLGEHWIEMIDGQEHMLKAVEGPCERCDISHTILEETEVMK